MQFFSRKNKLTKGNETSVYHYLNLILYDNEKIWRKCQSHTPTTRKAEGINKSRGLQKAFNKGGIPLPVKSSQYPI